MSVSERDGTTSQAAPSRAQLIAAFAALYVIWGSTYLAILYAIETLPPFLMAGVRFMVAGAALYIVLLARGGERPRPIHWRTAIIVGGLLLLGGNGGVVWAEQHVPSGIASLIVATVPVWMVLLEALRRGGQKPTGGVVAGLVLGMAGLVVLIGPGEIAGGGTVDRVGAAVLLFGSLSWAFGSIYSRGAPLPRTPLLFSAMQMLAGGALLIVAGAVAGELGALDTMQPSRRSMLALLYLILFGSLIGYTAYIWLLRVSTPAKVATYAYVNPVVAVFLGWAFAGESVTRRTLLAAAIIVAAVALITTSQASRATTRSGTSSEGPRESKLASSRVTSPRQRSRTGSTHRRE